jgi:hypothetical protein
MLGVTAVCIARGKKDDCDGDGVTHPAVCVCVCVCVCLSQQSHESKCLVACLCAPPCYTCTMLVMGRVHGMRALRKLVADGGARVL